MDNWQTAQNWLIFGGIAGSLGIYYHYTHSRPRAQQQQLAARRRGEVDTRAKGSAKHKPEGQVKDGPTAAKVASSSGTKKRKAPKTEQADAPVVPTIAAQLTEQDVAKDDVSNRQFAERMVQARKGADLSKPKNQEQRVRTVKPGRALDHPVLSSGSSQAGADADDDMSPASSPALRAGDVSDMLEPAKGGPSILRLTAPTQPEKQKVARPPKEEVVETKKQRQHRLKKEQARAEREAQEAERRALEEKQRRTAREARGEPAKNGMSMSKAPATNAWTSTKSPSPRANNAPPAANGTINGPLLDTFDAESTASSNGAMEASTAATSTTEAEPPVRDHDQLSEEEQIALALKQSEDESGWSVAAPKKQQKKKQTPLPDATGKKISSEATLTKNPTTGKANGFLALGDQGDGNDGVHIEA